MSVELLRNYAEFAVIAFTSILFILNPLATLTIFVSLSDGMSAKQRKNVAARAAFTSFLVLVIFMLLGNFIFKFFGISLPAFRVAGGIIIFGIGYKMLRGRPTTEKHHPDDISEAMDQDDFALVPLAIPMLAGPGTISTVMVLTGEIKHFIRFPIIFLAIAFATFLAYLILWQAEWILARISKVVIKTMNRVMGLVLCVIAVQFVMSGIKNFFFNG